jgi:glycosyltransferase involved in cell wall biosynthesis
MRILVAAERLGRAGGMERYLDIVLPALLARGATLHVLARELDAVPNGVTAQQVAWGGEHDAPSDAARAATARALASFAPDAAVAHNVMDAGIVEALRGAPRLVYHVHDHRPFCPNGDRVFPRTGRNCTESLGRPCRVHALLDGCAYGPRRRTAQLIASRRRLRDGVATSDAVVVASRYVGDRAHVSGIPADRIVEIPLPLPDEAYAEGAAAVAAPHGPAARSIVFAGRVVPQKGLDALVRAVARIAPQRRPLVRALGDGPALAEVRDEAARRGVELDAPGTVAPEAVRAALDGAALATLPSRWAEPFGYVGIEAFARGRPVVAFDVGGVRAWLDDGVNGVAVNARDERAFAGALDALLGDDDRRAQLAQRARQDAERFRAARIVEALLSAYCPR